MSKSSNKNKNNSSYEYLSLQDATRLCNYSQEYLSLRARQGKLKALKLGRNWVTKKEWLKEYVGQVEGYNNQANNHKKIKEKIIKIKEKTIDSNAPENLPIEKFRISLPNLERLRPALAFAVVFVLLAVSGVIGKESLFRTFNNLDRCAEKIDQGIELAANDIVKISQKTESAAEDIASFIDKFAQKMAATSQDILTGAGYCQEGLVLTFELAGEYSAWLQEGYADLEDNINQNYLAAVRLAQEKAVAGLADNFKEGIEATVEEGIEIMVFINSHWQGRVETKGITIVDKATGQPYCISMENGQLASVAGRCNILGEAELSDIEDSTSTETSADSSATSTGQLF